MYLNRIEIIGRLGRSPEIKEGVRTRAGMSVCTSRKFKKPDGTMGEVKDWHLVTAWGKLAEVIGGFSLSSGTPVYVSGEMRYTAYEGKDGSQKMKAEIIASEIQVLSTKAERSEGDGFAAPAPKKDKPKADDFDDEADLPF